MKSVTFNEIAGQLATPDVEMMKTFLGRLFQPNDLIVYAASPVPQKRGYKFLHEYETLEAALSTTQEQFEGVCEPPRQPVTDLMISETYTNAYNSYVAVNPQKRNLGVYRRGGVDNVAKLRTLYCDVDVKKGSFSSQAEIMSWVNQLPLRPTMIVGSGSGGVHLYWVLDGDVDTTEAWLQGAWIKYLQMTTDRSLDVLVDCSRILRLPGALRYDATYKELPVRVELLGADGPVHPVDAFKELTHNINSTEIKLRKENRAKEKQRQEKINDYFHNAVEAEKDGNPDMAFLIKIANLEDYINAKVAWDDILEPAGWTVTKEYNDGRRQWQRPGTGADPRSAVTDYEQSNCMSLLSGSEDTLLADIKERGEALSKYRVLLRLTYEENYEALVADVRAGKFDDDSNT